MPHVPYPYAHGDCHMKAQAQVNPADANGHQQRDPGAAFAD
ncbi:MAG TPA: hypothetical protein VN720_09090 [Rudaea sp.]|nr:hypothetical protein [Rudaea sp.]